MVVNKPFIFLAVNRITFVRNPRRWNVVHSLLILNFVKIIIIIIIITVKCKDSLSESWTARLIQWRKSLSYLMTRRSLPSTGTAEVGTNTYTKRRGVTLSMFVGIER